MTQAKKGLRSPKPKTAKRSSRPKASTGAASTRKRSRSFQSAPAAKRASNPRKPQPEHGAKRTKSAMVLALLGRKEGATLAELMGATGWQAHSVRGFLSGTVRKRLNLPLHSKVTDDVRRYRIEGDAGSRRASS